MTHKADQFISGGKTIRVDKYGIGGPVPLPAVLVIHGASVLTDRSAYMQDIATSLASRGLTTWFVHYFDRTGHEYASDEEIHANFLDWLATLNDAVDHMASDPDVDATRMACFGFSLGGYLSIALAAREERIGAVIELAGGVDPGYVSEISRLPSTLILHGEDDKRVLVANAHFLAELLTKLGVDHECHLYPGESHVLSMPAIADVIDRSVSFIERRLGNVQA